MLITEKITLSNDGNKIHITPEIMFNYLFDLYFKRLKRFKEKNKPYSGDVGRNAYKIFQEIMLSQIILNFIEWKPYIKSINLERIGIFLSSKLGLNWNNYRIYKDKSYKSKDYQIDILYFLYEKGVFFDHINQIPHSILKLTRLYLYGEYLVNKLFEDDFREGEMNIFSNKKDIYYSYHDRYNYRTRYHYYASYDEYPEIRLNYHEYSQAQSGTSNVAYVNTTYFDNYSITTHPIAFSTSNTEATTVNNTSNITSNYVVHNDFLGGDATWNLAV